MSSWEQDTHPAPNNLVYALSDYVMGDKIIDLYLALSQQCEIITQHPNWNHYVLEQTLIACKDIRVEHLWIGAPGRILQDPCFLVAAQELFELQQRGQVDQLTLQFHATDQVVVSDAPPILRNFSLSLIVCESPLSLGLTSTLKTA